MLVVVVEAFVLLPFVVAIGLIVKSVVQWFRHSRQLSIRDLLLLTAIVATSLWIVTMFKD
jgi:hypothetical protein